MNSKEFEEALAARDQRIAALENMVAALQRTLAKPASKSVLAPTEEGVRVFELAPRTSYEMPNESQMRQLEKISRPRLAEIGLALNFSGLNAEEKEEKYFQGFCNSFFALGHISRSSTLNRKYNLSHWKYFADEILRKHDRSRELEGFVAAAIVQGVLFNNPREFPYILELGLADFGGIPAKSETWRQILAAGKAPTPTEVKAPNNLSSTSFVQSVG